MNGILLNGTLAKWDSRRPGWDGVAHFPRLEWDIGETGQSAVIAGADRFLTNNRKDFPKTIAEVEIVYPDELPA